MADHRVYFSVMGPAASSGTFEIDLTTLDSGYNTAIVATISGITTSMSEINIASQIEGQLTAILSASGALYNGVPSFSAEPYPTNFAVTSTEHVVCIWSESQFSYNLTNDTTGGLYTFSWTPCLMTVATAKRICVPLGIPLVDTITNMAWTNQQIADFIEMGCADFISTARNNIVLSTYLGEFRTNMTKSIFLRPLPVLECDQPRIRRKNLYEMYSIPQYSSLAYDLIRRSGELIFRFNQLYVNAGEPFDMDNEVRVTFRSGYPQIPKEVQKCVLLVAASINNPPRGLESLGGGSLKAKWRDPKKELYRIYQPVRKYIMTEQRA